MSSIRSILDDRQVFGKPKINSEFGVLNPLTFDTWERDATKFYCTKSMIDAGECEQYMEFVYEMDNEVVITTRRYKKIPALMGEFGGILKLLTTAFVILFFYYSVTIKSFLFKKVFGFEKPKARKIMKRAAEALQPDFERKKSLKQGRPQNDSDGRVNSVEPKISQPKNWQKKNYNSNLKKALKNAVDSKTNITELVKKMNILDFLKNACLKKHHQTLLPLVILKSEHEQYTSEETKSTDHELMVASKEENNDSPFDTNFQGLNNQQKEGEEERKNEVMSLAENELFDKTKNQQRLIEDFETYNSLKEVQPRNSFDKMISEEILCYLSLVYEQD